MDIRYNLSSGCKVCGSINNLEFCARCKMVAYCSSEHAISNRRRHDRRCRRLKVIMRYCSRRADLTSPKSIDDRELSANAVLEIGTRTAVEAARDMYLDTLKIIGIGREDKQRIRGIAAHLMLRLGEDQRCCNMLLGKEEEEQEEDANAFESLDLTMEQDVCYYIAITLVKLRMLRDLEYMRDCRMALGSKILPRELINQIQHYTLTSTIIYDSKEKYDNKDNTELIGKLKVQVEELFMHVYRRNRGIWAPFVTSQTSICRIPDQGAYNGDFKEARAVLEAAYTAWWETPGARDALRKFLNCSEGQDEEESYGSR